MKIKIKNVAMSFLCGIMPMSMKPMQEKKEARINATCAICHQRATIESHFLVTDSAYFLRCWAQDEIKSGDRKWWIVVHPLGYSLIDRCEQLLDCTHKWYLAVCATHPNPQLLASQVLNGLCNLFSVLPDCLWLMQREHVDHLDCLAKEVLRRPHVQIELPPLLPTGVSAGIDALKIELAYSCPQDGLQLTSEEIKILKHYLDITDLEWYKKIITKKELIDVLRKKSIEEPDLFDHLLATIQTLKKYSYVTKMGESKKIGGSNLYPENVFDVLAQLILYGQVKAWVKEEEAGAEARLHEREAYRAARLKGEIAQAVKEESHAQAIRSVILKSMSAQLTAAAAGDYSTTFIGFQRIVEAVKRGPERINASEDLALFLAAQSNFADFQRFLGEPETIVEELNFIRDEVARRWIRNAAARVFNKPLRSFLEIVLNACDAVNQGKVVGKFGMGFLSILQLLSNERTKGVKITIQTAPLPDEYTPQPFAYQMTIGLAKPWAEIDFSRDFDVQIGFEKLPEHAGLLGLIGANGHGTYIAIEPNEGEFTQTEIDELSAYMHYLDFYEPVRTHVVISDARGETGQQIGGVAAEPHIEVTLEPKRLSVFDRGRGISLYVALYKLFIPSSSTKKIGELKNDRQKMRAQEPVRNVTFEQFKGKMAGDTLSHFIITVNGVVVIDVDLPERLRATEICDLVLRMPAAAQLTLARDELMIGYDAESPDGLCPEEVYVQRVIRATIDECIRTQKDTDLLQALFEGLKEWEDRSSNAYIKGRLSGYLRTYLNDQLAAGRVVAAPKEFMERLIKSKNINLACVPVGLSPELANYDYSALEKHIVQWYEGTIPAAAAVSTMTQIKQDAINDDLIKGMRVIFVPAVNELVAQDEVTQCGLKDILFVSERMLEQAKSGDMAKTKVVLVNNIANRFVNRDFSSKKAYFEGLVISNTTDEVCDCGKKIVQEFIDHLRTHKDCGYDCLEAFNRKYAFGKLYIGNIRKARLTGAEKSIVDLADAEIDYPSQRGDAILREYFNLVCSNAAVAKTLSFSVDLELIDRAPMILRENDNELAKAWLKKYEDILFCYHPNILIFSEKLPAEPRAYRNFVNTWVGAPQSEISFIASAFYANSKMLFYDVEKEVFYRKIQYDTKEKAGQIQRFRDLKAETKSSTELMQRFCREYFFPYVRQNVNNIFEVVPAYKIFNAVMFNVLSPFGIFTQKDVDDPAKKIMIGENRVWPAAKTVDELGRLYLALSEFGNTKLLLESEKVFTLSSVDYFAFSIGWRGYETVLVKTGASEFFPVSEAATKKFSEMQRAGRIDYNVVESYIERAVKNSKDPVCMYVNQMIQCWKKEGLRFVGLKVAALNQELLQPIKNEIAHIADIDRPLYKNFVHFSLLNSLVPLLNVAVCMKDIALLPVMQTFQDKIKSIFEMYAQIPAHFIPFEYGKGERLIQAQNPEPEIGAEQVAHFLTVQQAFAHDDERALKRLCQLTVDDLNLRCDRLYQQEDLSVRQLYVPHVLFNSPLALLAQLHRELALIDQAYALEVIATILQKARNSKELVFAVNMLLRPEIMRLFDLKEQKDREELCHAVGLLCSAYIPEKVDKDVIADSFLQGRKWENAAQKDGYYQQLSFNKTIHEYLQSFLNPALLEQTNVALNNELVYSDAAKHLAENATLMTANDLNEPLLLTLKQLINAQVAGRGIKGLLDQEQLDEAKEIIARARTDFDLGKITQSIEFGSEREPIIATLIECLQNSVDATRDFLQKIEKKNKKIQKSYAERLVQLKTADAIAQQLCTIEYALEVYRSEADRARVCLSITDHVGFPSLTQLLTDFLLPDYSAKSPALGNVGDMGNGTFKMYQHASRVFVLTRTTNNPDHCYLLIIEPVRNVDSGLIEDLRLDCHDVSAWMGTYNPAFFGTSFKILFEQKSLPDIKADLLQAKDFLFDCLNSVDVQFGENQLLRLMLNQRGEQIHLNKERARAVYQHRFGQLSPDAQKKLEGRREDYIYKNDAPIFRFLSRPYLSMQSYLTTNGVPFKSLGAVLEQEELLPPEFISHLRSGYVVDLALNTYEPVQSRTRLKMDSAFKNELKRALLEAYFVLGLKKASAKETAEHFLATHFMHFNSSVDEIAQLLFGQEKDAKFQRFYAAFTQGQVCETYPTEADFFNFYMPISVPEGAPAKSLCQFVKLLYDDHSWIYWQLKNLLLDSSKEVEKKINEEIKNLKSLYPKDKSKSYVTDDEKKAIVDVLKKFYESVQKRWEELKDGLIKEWQEGMARFFGVGPWLTNIENPQWSMIHHVLIPWAEKKLLQMKLRIPDVEVLLLREPTFITKAELDAKDAARKAAAGSLGVWAADPFKANEAIVNRLKEYNIKLFVDGLIETYVRAFFSLINVPGKKDPVNAAYCYANSQSKVLGSFNGRDLAINLSAVGMAELIDLGMHILWFNEGVFDDDAVIKVLPAYTQLFDPTPFDVGTVLHELEHARRGESCREGAHGDGKDVQGVFVNFNAAARSWAELAVSRGVFTQWLQNFGAFVQKKGPVFDALKKMCQADERTGVTKIVSAAHAVNLTFDKLCAQLGFPNR